LFPRKIDDVKVDFHRIEKMDCTVTVQMTDVGYEVEIPHATKFLLRKKPSSDVNVFEQIFGLKEYEPVIGLVNNGLKNQDFIMIDAGANIGLASIYLMQRIPCTKLFLIEPLPANYDILVRNMKSAGLAQISKCYLNAISSSIISRFEISSDFRDGKDWSNAVIPNNDGNVFGISVMDIINANNLPYISYLKLDIEGSERFLFATDADTKFLDFVKIISIEIHDEYNIREHLLSVLSKNGFVVFDSGEMTIGFKPELLSV
jgi:FkbM family methyltransferase